MHLASHSSSESHSRASVGGDLREVLRYQTYAPKGVHVAHVVIDGVIESPNTKAWATKAGVWVHVIGCPEVGDWS